MISEQNANANMAIPKTPIQKMLPQQNPLTQAKKSDAFQSISTLSVKLRQDRKPIILIEVFCNDLKQPPGSQSRLIYNLRLHGACNQTRPFDSGRR